MATITTEQSLCSAYPIILVGGSLYKLVPRADFQQNAVVSHQFYGIETNTAGEACLTAAMLSGQGWRNDSLTNSLSDAYQAARLLATIFPSCNANDSELESMGIWYYHDRTIIGTNYKSILTIQHTLNLSEQAGDQSTTVTATAHASNLPATQAMPDLGLVASGEYAGLMAQTLRSKTMTAYSDNLMAAVLPDYAEMSIQDIRNAVGPIVYLDPQTYQAFGAVSDGIDLRPADSGYVLAEPGLYAHIQHALHPIIITRFRGLDLCNFQNTACLGIPVVSQTLTIETENDPSTVTDTAVVPTGGGPSPTPEDDNDLYQVRNPQRHAYGIGKKDELIQLYKKGKQ